jgi:hypothetical protein
MEIKKGQEMFACKIMYVSLIKKKHRESLHHRRITIFTLEIKMVRLVVFFNTQAS